MQRTIIAVAAFLITSGASAQNLLLNSSFESPGLPSGEPFRLLNDGSTFIPGWTVIDDGIGQPAVYVQRPNSDAIIDGTYGLILNQGSGVRTTFRAQIGSFYELAVWVRPGDCGQCVSPAPLRVTISGNEHTVPLVSGWSQQTIQFFATNSLNTLELFNPSSATDFKQFGIDNVTITKLNGATLNLRLYPGVIVQGFPGQKYEIQTANDLNSPNWVTVTNIFLTNSPFLFIDRDPVRSYDQPPARQRIYRAIQVP